MDHLDLSFWLSTLSFVILGLSIVNLLLNLKWFKRLDQFPLANRWPKVSVLVPARNEEQNIRACVQSLINQDYPDFEVIVLDDESTDDTGKILAQISEQFHHLVIIKGHNLPAGWTGKNWACHQLSVTAKGEFLLFTDADTIHHPLTLKEGISALLSQNADLLTVIPYEKLGSWGEKILLPYLFFSCLAFFPIGIAHRLRNSALCFAIGQFMFFKRSAYLQIGGHERIKGVVMEDLNLGRMIKKAGLLWRMADGGLRVQCRMYHNFYETWKGLSRFLFLGYDNNILQLFVVWAVTGMVVVGPILALILRASGAMKSIPYWAITITIFLEWLLWALAYWRLRIPILLSFFFPVTYLLNFAATIYSGFLTMTGRTTWKGRPMAKPEN
jgi:chlorobactene glucosyltransferase